MAVPTSMFSEPIGGVQHEKIADSDDNSRGSIEKPTATADHAERLDELGDPDAGKTDEERAKIDKKLVWKIDKWLIPWLCLLYLLSFLDRTNIGNARLAGLKNDLGMEGHDYNNAHTIFFISYALAEPVTNVLLKRFTPRVFFTGIILLWGLMMTMMDLVTNYAGLLACRLLLGLAEAGLFPGVNCTQSDEYIPYMSRTLADGYIHHSYTTSHAGTSAVNSVSERLPSSLLPPLPDRSVVFSPLPLR